MIINRENYGIWITDYYDGQLDNFQVDILMDFLRKNPDLMAEFEDFPDISLKPGKHEAYPYGELLHSPDQLSEEQVEHFSIALHEGDLTRKQEEEIESLKYTDPRFRKSVDQYAMIKLTGDDINFPDKDKLLAIPGRRKRIRRLVNTISIAASLAIIMSLFFIINTKDDIYSNRPLSLNNPAPVVEKEETVEELPVPDISQMPVYTASSEKDYAPRQVIKTIPETEPLVREQERKIYNIDPIPLKENITLGSTQNKYLLANMEPYPVTGEPLKQSFSVREFLAYQFRKNILDEENPEASNIKAYEIADAGIKGINFLLGWEMDLKAEKSGEGKFENISFTSELVKFGHSPAKN
ncbi:MAG TPA: hypothetical protein VJ877_07340 [Bacteroidales bacterium]|nr:hypothetical protein [Bacteroidales bacterium]